jgi:hypothetical protein
VITAGNVLELSMRGSVDGGDGDYDDRRHDDAGDSPPAPTVTSVRYHVSVGTDAQSARGKLRARNKRPKKNGKVDRNGNGGMGPTIVVGMAEAGVAGGGGRGGGEDARGGVVDDDNNDDKHDNGGDQRDGNVEPRDPLCTITLSDGRRLLLRCCVGGTVIEVNRRLLHPTSSLYPSPSPTDVPVATAPDCPCPRSSLTTLLEDPLLDGYLAVIIPAKRGAFPPIRGVR